MGIREPSGATLLSCYHAPINTPPDTVPQIHWHYIPSPEQPRTVHTSDFTYKPIIAHSSQTYLDNFDEILQTKA